MPPFGTPSPTLDDESRDRVLNVREAALRARSQAALARAHARAVRTAVPGSMGRAHKRLQLLAAAGSVLGTSLDYETTLASVAGLLVPELADWCAIDLIAEDSKSISRLQVTHSDPAKAKAARRFQQNYPLDLNAPHWAPQVLRSGEPEFYPNIDEAVLTDLARSEEHRRLLRELGLRSALVVPLIARDRILGAITLVLAESGRQYEEADLELALDLARRVALAVDNARLYREAQEQRENAEVGAQALARSQFDARQSANQLRLITDALPAVVAYVDSEERYRFVNVTHEAWYGTSSQEVLGKTMFEFLGTQNYEMYRPYAREALAGRRVTFEVTVEYPKAGPKHVIATYVPDLDESNRARGFVALVQDITDRKRTEDKLQRSEEQYRRFIEKSAEAVWRFDLDEPIAVGTPEEEQVERLFQNAYLAECNNAMARMYGHREASDIVGTRLPDILPRDNPRNVDFVRTFIRSGYRLEEAESQQTGISGEPQYFVNNLVGIVENGLLSHAWGTQRDTTDRRRAEEELRLAVADLARSNQELEHFALIASHDLREPLRKVAGFAELLGERYENQLDSTADRYIRYITSGTARMEALIRSLRTYSRLGGQSLHLQPTDLNEVVRQVLADLEVAIREARASVVCTLLPVVSADPLLIQQLMQNLVENAVKFRGEKPARIQISSEHQDSEWVISVRDEGIGIEPQHRARIFMIFQRLHTDNEYKGMGVGLTVCKKIVDRHRGRIWVDSEPGRGSTFRFSLPVT